MVHLAKIALFILALSLAGCGLLQTTHKNGTLSKFDDVADKFSCGISASTYEKLPQPEQDELKRKSQECFTEYKNVANKELRLLRAGMVATVLTRYGIAKIEDYSESKDIDTTMLVSKLNPLVKKLKEAKTKLANKDNQVEFSDYDVLKADLYVLYIDLAIISTRPVKKELQNLLFASNTEKLSKGGDILINALETSLYKEAYVNQMHALRKAVTADANKYDDAWMLLSNQLKDQCSRIKLENSSINPVCDLQ